MFKENLPKRDPCQGIFWPKNPPIWAAHTRTLNMLCTPPPGPSFILSKQKKESRTMIYISVTSHHNASYIFHNQRCLRKVKISSSRFLLLLLHPTRNGWIISVFLPALALIHSSNRPTGSDTIRSKLLR